jgi:hypothetical protein
LELLQQQWVLQQRLYTLSNRLMTKTRAEVEQNLFSFQYIGGRQNGYARIKNGDAR